MRPRYFSFFSRADGEDFLFPPVLVRNRGKSSGLTCLPSSNFGLHWKNFWGLQFTEVLAQIGAFQIGPKES
jgi:hypothetical protein